MNKQKYDRAYAIALAEEGNLNEMVMFWGHRPSADGSITRSCFSQWWKSDFVYEGVKYCCMEQCMMAGKARLFGDSEVLEFIMGSTDQEEIKAMGRCVRNFDSTVWDAHKYELVRAGNLCKFSQNPALREFILSTGDSMLVEASPYDRIWGIGLHRDDARSRDPRTWRGENLLGFALMEVRDAIRCGEY